MPSIVLLPSGGDMYFSWLWRIPTFRDKNSIHSNPNENVRVYARANVSLQGAICVHPTNAMLNFNKSCKFSGCKLFRH